MTANHDIIFVAALVVLSFGSGLALGWVLWR